MTNLERDRRYAADLLSRAAGEGFDHAEVALVARLLPVIENDVANWLDAQLRGTVSRGLIVAAVREGRARP